MDKFLCVWSKPGQNCGMGNNFKEAFANLNEQLQSYSDAVAKKRECSFYKLGNPYINKFVDIK